MSDMKVRNPFFIKGYHGPEYFCDRVQETERLLAAIRNGRDVTLMAPRRYGKTGLIHNVFARLEKDFVPIYLDIFQMRSLAEFTRAFSEKVVSELATPLERTGKGLLEFFRGCRPTLTPQEDGKLTFSFDVLPSKAEATLKETFAFLEARKVEPVIAIDEFQQVREFPETGVEALLRSHVQFCRNAHFIFAGSKKHLMEEMFALPRGPFYQSTQLMSLDVIDRTKYADFAQRFFVRSGRAFDRTAFERLYARFEGITWYLQAVLNRVWENPEGLDDAAVEAAVGQLVDESALTYSDLLGSQTGNAQRILRALAASGGVAEISAKAFLDQYRLPAASSVRSTVADLVDRNLVDRSAGGYRVYDRLFALWLRAEGGAHA